LLYDITTILNSWAGVMWVTFPIVSRCCFYCYGVVTVSI